MTESDFDRAARLWLEDGPNQLSDRVLQAALDEIHVTRQRRAVWPAWRFPSMSNTIRLAAAVAVLVVAVVGIRYFSPGDGGLGHQQASLAPLPSPRGSIVVADRVQLEPGTYVTADDFLTRVFVTVPANWDGHLGGPYLLDLVRIYGSGEVMVAIFDTVYADPCHFDRGLLEPVPGPTVDDLATALTNLPGLQATKPTDVTVSGYAGKQFTITAPANFNGCTLGPEGYTVWELPLGAPYAMFPGQHDRVWILDVEGQRVVIDAPDFPGETPEAKAEVQGILDTIRLAPKTSPTPKP